MPVVPCPPNTPVEHGIVVFDPTAFKAAFPEFSTVADAVLDQNFDMATLVIANTCEGVVLDAVKREKLLNLATAHITQLRNGANGGGPSGVVGQLIAARQGSINIGVAEIKAGMNQVWFTQTPWGMMLFAALAPYRTFRYVPAPPADDGIIRRPFGPDYV
jgi:hypothetical protein